MVELEDRITPAVLVARIQKMATLPDVFLRIRDVIENPASRHADVAAVIATDPVISARILKIANSAFYGRPSNVSTISLAVSLLGTQQVYDMVLATVVIQSSSKFNLGPVTPREFWHNSLMTASCAKLLAEHCNILDSEYIFVAALLSQLGQLILIHEIPDEMNLIMKKVQNNEGDIPTLQFNRLGFDYADVSAELFSVWDFPSELVTPIRYHTHPSSAIDTLLEASILHIAVQLSYAMSQNTTLDQLLTQLDDVAWKKTKISREYVEQLQLDTMALTEEIAPFLLDMAS
ncbi:MAG: HDOD domain-containing protein [Gammaproteobacteria bacterium]|nr:HDOD domain-containing protein [Gammaproteobacteria bacterium]